MEKNISKYLAFRWMALYMLFCDDDLDRANFALSEKIVELEEKVRRTDGSAAMTAEDRAALLNQLLAKEVSSFQEIPWETEPADVAQNLELAVARRVEELSTRIEPKPGPTGGYKLWARVGVSFVLSRDEVRQVLISEDSASCGLPCRMAGLCRMAKAISRSRLRSVPPPGWARRFLIWTISNFKEEEICLESTLFRFRFARRC